MVLRYHQPDNEDAFEQMCLRFYRKYWKNDSLTLYAKRGEKQYGVDIHDPACLKPVRAVQCKHHEPTKTLKPAEIKEEVRKAEESPLPIDHYIIATTAKKSSHAQNTIVKLNARPPTERKFTVDLYFWEDICERLTEFSAIQAEFIIRGQDLGADLVHSILQDPSIASVVARVLLATDSPAGAFAEIEQLLADRNFDAARHELDKLGDSDKLATRSKEDQYQLLRLRGKLAMEIGEFNVASTFFLAAYERSPGLDQAKHNQVLGYYLASDSTRAFELASQYVASGIATPGMLSRLIENATTLEQINGHMSRIEPYLATDQSINIALCHKLSHLSDAVGAADAAKRAVTIAPESAHAQFTAALPHHNAALKGNWRTRKSKLQQAIAHYDSALQAARKQKYAGLLPEILTNRARAHILLGNLSAGAADYREAVAVADRPESYAASAVSAFLHLQEFAAAWELLESLDKGTFEGRFLTVATEFHNAEDEEERFQYLEQMKLLAEEEWPRAVECRFHCVHWALLLKDPVLGRSCITEKFLAAYPFHAHTALAWIDLEAGQKEDALKHANEAIGHGINDAHAQEIRLLAETFARLSDHGTAIDLLEHIAIPGLFDDDMKCLITCAQRLERHDLLLRICRELRETGQQNDQLRQVEIQLLNRYAPEQGLAVADEFIKTSASPAYFVAFKNFLAIRLNRLEQVQLEPSRLPGPRDLPASKAPIVTLPYVKMGLFDEALRFLHAQLRAYFDDERAHGHYVMFFLMHGSTTSLRVPPDKVQAGCAVLIEVDGAKRWVVIENESPLRSRSEFAESSELAQQFIGHAVGDLIELPGLVRPQSATIREIQTKYVRSFQDCLQHFRERFPETSFLQQVHLGHGDEFDPTPIIESLKDRRKYVEECIEFYISKLCPLHLLAERIGVSELDAVAALGNYRTGFVKCCQTTPEDFERAVHEEVRPAAVVLDLSAIITLTLVDGWKHLDVDRMYFVSQATKEVVDQWVSEAKDEHLHRSGHASLTESGELVRHEATPEQRAVRQAYLENIHKMLKDHCECRASEAVAAIEPDKRKVYQDVVGFHHVEALSLARDLNAILWSDDIVISSIAVADFGVTSVWTQLALSRLTHAGRVSVDDYQLVSCRLAGLHYITTVWSAETVIRAGVLVNWDPQEWPFKQCIELIATSENPLGRKARLALGSLRLLRRSSCGPLRQSAVIQAILTAVGNRKAVAWINERLETTFGIDVASVVFLRPEVDYWMSSHLG